MCLILFAWRSHPQYRLLLAANRDEFYARPTLPAQYWYDAPHILAGRDVEQGGTWLGIAKNHRFAAVTNVRDPSAPLGSRSRGHLVKDFLDSDQTPAQFLLALQKNLSDYSPFNVLVSDGDTLHYGNSHGEHYELTAGIYGLSNATLNTPWPKVETGKQALIDVAQDDIIPDHLFDLLADQHIAHDDHLPQTGIPLELERKLSSRFIHFDTYGTRCSTVLLQPYDGRTAFYERQFDARGIALDTVAFEW